MQGKRMAELSKELLAYLEERGNSEKAQANYRYILNVLTEYSVQHNEGYYSEEILWAYVMERYGLTKDGTYRSRTAHHKAKIIRILKVLADFNAGKIPPSRYIQKSEELETPLFQDTVEKYQQHYLKCGYSISGVKNYRREAVKLLRFCETNGRRSFSEISASLIQDYLLTLEGKAKATIKNALGGMRSFLKIFVSLRPNREELGRHYAAVEHHGEQAEHKNELPSGPALAAQGICHGYAQQQVHGYAYENINQGSLIAN